MFRYKLSYENNKSLSRKLISATALTSIMKKNNVFLLGVMLLENLTHVISFFVFIILIYLPSKMLL